MQGLYKYLLISFFLLSCVQRERHEGIVIDKNMLSSLQSGSSKEETIRNMGSPSFVINTEGLPETWVYTSIEKRWRAFFKTNVIASEVIEIEFLGDKITQIKNNSEKGLEEKFFKDLKNLKKPSGKL